MTPGRQRTPTRRGSSTLPCRRSWTLPRSLKPPPMTSSVERSRSRTRPKIWTWTLISHQELFFNYFKLYTQVGLNDLCWEQFTFATARAKNANNLMWFCCIILVISDWNILTWTWSIHTRDNRGWSFIISKIRIFVFTKVPFSQAITFCNFHWKMRLTMDNINELFPTKVYNPCHRERKYPAIISSLYALAINGEL